MTMGELAVGETDTWDLVSEEGRKQVREQLF